MGLNCLLLSCISLSYLLSSWSSFSLFNLSGVYHPVPYLINSGEERDSIGVRTYITQVSSCLFAPAAYLLCPNAIYLASL